MDTYEIEEIEVRRLAIVLGTMGLFWAVFWIIIGLVMGLASGPFPGGAELLAGAVGFPVGGVVIGILVAIFYNLAAVFVGGIRLSMTPEGSGESSSPGEPSDE
ncbi:MAG: hypothetical protein ABEI31_04370 [Halodesulfurarchaeum sp.]